MATTDTIPTVWHDIGEYARFTPSPHNTQPLRIKPIDELHAELYYDLSRALPEGDPPARFAFTAVGLFSEACLIAAASLGYKLDREYLEQPLDNRAGHGLQLVSRLQLTKQAVNEPLSAELLYKRRTVRVAYNNKPVDPAALDDIKAVAKQFGHTLEVRTDAAAVNWVSRLNKRMVFYDLDDKQVRDELARWSRFNKHSAHRTHDGLSAECLHVPGWGLWLFMKHYGLLHVPGIRQLLQFIYWQNMQGITTVAWLEGPFSTTKDYLSSGHILLRVWLTMAKHDVAYHPFGSVITNQRAHEEFRDYFKLDETKSMAWLLMRIGYAAEPVPRSERLPLEELFL